MNLLSRPHTSATRKLRLFTGFALALSAGLAQAHTGHGTTGFREGLIHPFGIDHLLAMVAVGIWSVCALPQDKVWRGPAAFMLALIAGASLGAAGFSVPFLEQMVSISVILFGAMLILSRSRMPALAGLAVVAVAALLHGLAHGAETPASGFAGYAIGFLITTAALHFGGVAAAQAIRRHVPAKADLIVGALGGVFGGAGVYLFSQF